MDIDGGVKKLGPFLLQSVLGEGGMGCVYEGKHISTGKRYAIKTSHVTVPCLRGRLRAEIRALSELRHPFVVQVRMNGVEDEIPWYAMDLLDGPTLRGYIQHYQESAEIDWHALVRKNHSIPTRLELPHPRKPVGELDAPSFNRPKDRSFLDLKWICRFFQRLCEALDYLHSRGIVHADIKPENIFVIEKNRPMLVDLGISSMFCPSPRDVLQTSARTSGSIYYSPPEQIEGELLDPRSDLYALGCTLYECLTGVHPFQRDSMIAVYTAKATSEFLSPSHYRSEIPPALDFLIGRLLAPDPHHRIGYAADVAAGLGRIAPLPEHEKAAAAAASTYLYRPPFIGRADILDRFSRVMDEIMSGKGAGILIRGESGIGKTRLISEVSKEARRKGIATVGLSCARFLEQERAVSETPAKGTIQSLLWEIEEAGLATAHSSQRPPHADAEMGKMLVVSEVSRASILESATSVLLACSKKDPILLVIDDFQWADDLLVQLVSEMTARHLKHHCILIVAMARTEPDTDENSPIFHTGLTDIHLPQLTDEEVYLQVRRMLAVDHPPQELLSYICEVSGGIPLLVVEHLHAAVDAGVLSRSRLRGWTVSLDREGGLSSAIPFSRSIKNLIENRLLHLDEQTRSLVQTAAVLGREVDLSELKELSRSNDEDLDRSIGKLLFREIVAFHGENHIRFTHARLHEHIYASMPAEHRVQLHRRAASVVEKGNKTPNQMAALAFHFDKCDAPEKAARYYEIAGRNAALNQQYGFAEQALESALENIARVEMDLERSVSIRTYLLEALGDVAVILRHHDKAAAAYKLVSELSKDDSLRLARQHRKLATVYQADRSVSLAHLQTALGYLEALGEEQSEIRSEWIQVNLQCLWAQYWGNEPAELLSLARRVEQTVEAHGSIKQRGELQLMTALGLMQYNRYVTDEDEIQRAIRAVDHLNICEDVQLASLARFVLSMIYLFAGQLDEARAGFEKTIADSMAASNMTLQLRGMTYLTFLHRRSYAVEPTRQMAAAILDLADVNAMPEYSAAALGNLAWVADLEGDLDATERLARDACGHWRKSPIGYPFWWTALFPLLHAMSEKNRAPEARWILHKLLEPKQQALPVGLTAAIELGQSSDDENLGNAVHIVLSSAREHFFL